MRAFKVYLLTFLFSIFANAQDSFLDQGMESYTTPSEQDLELLHDALSQCGVLNDVANSITHNTSVPSQDILDALQATDQDGNLLIENTQCVDTILDFVYSLCSSVSYQNQLYCSKLGILQDSNYKSFGKSAISNLDSYDWDQDVSSKKEFSFSVASSLLFFTPVRGFKFVKPVLSGAMLILATMGLASCDNITGPEQICNRGDSGYILLTRQEEGSDGEEGSAKEEVACIKLPTAELEFLVGGKRFKNQTDGVMSVNPCTEIIITFDGLVSYIDKRGHAPISVMRVLDMVDIRRIENCDDDSSDDYSDCELSDNNLLGSDITLNKITAGTDINNNSYIRIKPPEDMYRTDSSYRIEFENYVYSKDAPLAYQFIKDSGDGGSGNEDSGGDLLAETLSHAYFHVESTRCGPST